MGTKTGLAAQEAIFNRLINQGVKALSALSGAIYKQNRPKDSKLEDIVVRTLTMNADQVQEGIINVNIHVPNQNLVNDDTQPNLVRFDIITSIVVSTLSDYSGYDYWFDIDSPGVPERDGINWFVNVRIKFFSLRN